MTVLSDDEWRLIESAYLNSTETLESIAKRYNISASTIRHRRKKFGWRPRRVGTFNKKTKRVAESASDKATLVARMYRLINLKLEQMEEDMARSKERTPADNERETRALGTLIRNFEKVFGLEQESGDDGKQAGKGPEQHAEAEALRRELAERLVRIRKADQENDE